MSQTPPEPAPPLTVDCWLIDVAGCGDTTDWDAADDDARERAGRLAVRTLTMLAGGAVEPCPITVRPATVGCYQRTWATYPVSGPTTGGFSPRLHSGTWINLVCGSCGDGCYCGGPSTIVLRGATAVAQVTVDGVVLDESAYRLDQGGRLVRLDGGVWPHWQNLAAGTDGLGTFAVTYYATAPGRLGEQAAGTLALEWLAACSERGNCRLPSGTVQVARSGVTMQITPGSFPDGLTGIREVDLWVQSVNPHGLATPSMVWSPDVRHATRTMAPAVPLPAPGGFDGGAP